MEGKIMSEEAAETTSTTNETPAPVMNGEGWEWMGVEIMGFRKHWGRTREEERFGAKMMRVDVPIKGDPAANGWETHYYGGPAIFSFVLTDEATVMNRNKPYQEAARLTYQQDDEEEEDQTY
jgi:hypothetical protein